MNFFKLGKESTSLTCFYCSRWPANFEKPRLMFYLTSWLFYGVMNSMCLLGDKSLGFLCVRFERICVYRSNYSIISGFYTWLGGVGDARSDSGSHITSKVFLHCLILRVTLCRGKFVGLSFGS